MYNKCIDLLKSRNIDLMDIAQCVYLLQESYFDDLSIDYCLEIVKDVIEKREVQHAIITGLNLDIMADENMIKDPDLDKLLKTDESLYGIDEVLAYGICNLYGSIALTNFGYIDKVKPGIIGDLNNSKVICNTFADDIVGAIAASAASKIAHTKRR
ncbi:MAG: phosphatidylglycerophosphatase A [Erysipelotrichaceae bacterium]